MEMVDKLDNKRQMLNRTTERSEKIGGENIVNPYTHG